jgi:hypothetical protein
MCSPMRKVYFFKISFLYNKNTVAIKPIEFSFTTLEAKNKVPLSPLSFHSDFFEILNLIILFKCVAWGVLGHLF